MVLPVYRVRADLIWQALRQFRLLVQLVLCPRRIDFLNIYGTMMKRLVILHTLLGVSLFTACQQERLGETETAADAAELKLTVLAGNFLPADNASTRAIDNGSVTVFENGDRVGLIILGSNGVPVVDNRPYTFDGAGWTATGSALYYNEAMESCIVYYPYDERADGVTGVEELKDLFQPAEDQSSEEEYRKSDLLPIVGLLQRASEAKA